MDNSSKSLQKVKRILIAMAFILFLLMFFLVATIIMKIKSSFNKDDQTKVEITPELQNACDNKNDYAKFTLKSEITDFKVVDGKVYILTKEDGNLQQLLLVDPCSNRLLNKIDFEIHEK